MFPLAFSCPSEDPHTSIPALPPAHLLGPSLGPFSQMRAESFFVYSQYRFAFSENLLWKHSMNQKGNIEKVKIINCVHQG